MQVWGPAGKNEKDAGTCSSLLGLGPVGDGEAWSTTHGFSRANGAPVPLPCHCKCLRGKFLSLLSAKMRKYCVYETKIAGGCCHPGGRSETGSLLGMQLWKCSSSSWRQLGGFRRQLSSYCVPDHPSLLCSNTYFILILFLTGKTLSSRKGSDCQFSKRFLHSIHGLTLSVFLWMYVLIVVHKYVHMHTHTHHLNLNLTAVR